MTFLRMMKNGFGKSVPDEQWDEIQQSVSEENHRNLLAASLAFVAMLLALILLSPLSLKLTLSRPLYEIMIVSSLVVYAVTRHVRADDWKAVRFLTYLMISMFLAYATVLGTVFSTGQIATAFPAFVLASPLLFTDRRRHINVCIVIHTAFFVCMALAFDSPNLIADDIINSCLFAIVSMAINSYLIGIKLRNEYAQLQLAELGRKDLLTGVKSRNSYERALLEYPTRCKLSLSCIFADLNGLHELNEKAGHANGDEMLKCVSAALKTAFGADDVYRIGGDEFVVLACDIGEKELRLKVEHARRLTERQSCHVSFGASRSEVPIPDVNELVKRAELEMYADKRRYYEQEGIDRRGRRD